MSILTNPPTDRKYQFECFPEIKKIVIDEGNACWGWVFTLEKNNISVYFSRYIGHIDILGDISIDRYISFDLPSLRKISDGNIDISIACFKTIK